MMRINTLIKLIILQFRCTCSINLQYFLKIYHYEMKHKKNNFGSVIYLYYCHHTSFQESKCEYYEYQWLVRTSHFFLVEHYEV